MRALSMGYLIVQRTKALCAALALCAMALYKLSRIGLHLGNRQMANMYYERLRNEEPHSQYIAPLRRLGAR